MFVIGQDVLVITGKYSGEVGFIVHRTTKHHLSNDNRWVVKVQSGWGWVTLQINELNLSRK
jgi:hypothetical protein